MEIYKAAVSGILLGLVATPAQAIDGYLSLNAGAALYNDIAVTDTPAGGLATNRPVPINGLSFDGEESALGLRGGWQVLPWLAVELAYTDLGDIAAQNLPTVLSGGTIEGPALIVQDPGSLPGGGVIGTQPLPINLVPFPGTANLNALPAISRPTSLASNQFSVGAKLELPINPRATANLYLGLARTRYDVQGELRLPVFEIPAGDFPLTDLPPPSIVRIPNAAPADETAPVFGFGIEYLYLEDVGLELSFRRHDNDVLAVDSLMIGIIWRPSRRFGRGDR